jgi:hypothetical protein
MTHNLPAVISSYRHSEGILLRLADRWPLDGQGPPREDHARHLSVLMRNNVEFPPIRVHSGL